MRRLPIGMDDGASDAGGTETGEACRSGAGAGRSTGGVDGQRPEKKSSCKASCCGSGGVWRSSFFKGWSVVYLLNMRREKSPAFRILFNFQLVASILLHCALRAESACRSTP